MLLTDDLLLDYKRCQRRAFLNIHGNDRDRDPERDFLLKLRQESLNHVQTVLETYYPDYKSLATDRGDRTNAALETESLMSSGVNCIYHGVLQKTLDYRGYPVTLSASPHLLLKTEGESKFGNWQYHAVNIQLGRRPKPEYKILAAYFSYLLGSVQETLPDTAEIILRRHNRYSIDLSLWWDKLREILDESIRTLIEAEEPEVFISRQRCSLCHWYGHCYTIAREGQHLSLVPGVTPSRYEFLQSVGVRDLPSLAAISPTKLNEGLGIELAGQLQQQASAIVENRAFKKNSPKNRLDLPIPSDNIELFFDIEAEPEQNLDYLLGILLVDRTNRTEKFYSFLAEKPEDEALIWQDFLNLVQNYPRSPIFHFSEYEVETIKRLGFLYKTPKIIINNLIYRCYDLHDKVINSVIFPVESYSLKSLANWIGFHWQHRGASGDQCVWWYDRWLKTGDRELLNAILSYNEDDCRATFHLKNWLVQFLKE